MLEAGTGIAVFALSALLLLLTCAVIAARLASDPRAAFWILIGSAYAILASISIVLSAFSAIGPFPWLAVQVALAGAALARGCPFLSHRVRGLARGCTVGSGLRRFWAGLSRVGCPALLCAGLLVAFSAIKQGSLPIFGFDDRMYHASRALYWLERGSVFPYVTHNERQVLYPLGSELTFLWPLVFTRSELVGRMVFWLAFPGAAAGLYVLAREAGARRDAAVLAMLVFVATPLVLSRSLGVGPEIHLALLVEGIAFWCARAVGPLASRRGAPAGGGGDAHGPGSTTGLRLPLQHASRATGALFGAGFFALLAVGVGFTALIALPVIVALPWLARGASWRLDQRDLASGKGHGRRQRLAAAKPLALGVVAGLVLGGAAVTLGFNQARYGHPLGPEAYRRVVGGDLDTRRAYVHTARLVLTLVEVPALPFEGFRERIVELGSSFANRIGADARLPPERPDAWPGVFRWKAPRLADRFSLGGLVWLPLLGLSLLRLGGIVRRPLPGERFQRLAPVVLLQAILLAGTLYGVRWKPDSQLPERLLITPYALGLAVGAVLVDDLIRQRRWLASGVVLAIAATVLVPLVQQGKLALEVAGRPPPTSLLDEPFAEPLASIPPGSCILLVGEQNDRDYPLFAPREGYPNRVVSWGRVSFDPERMRALIDRERITHVLLTNDVALSFHWDPPVSTAPMVAWLAHEAGLREVPLSTPGMRLFAVARATTGGPPGASITAGRR